VNHFPVPNLAAVDNSELECNSMLNGLPSKVNIYSDDVELPAFWRFVTEFYPGTVKLQQLIS
jgi:hypothetical protein